MKEKQSPEPKQKTTSNKTSSSSVIADLLKIFLINFRIGLFTFGGGSSLTIMLQKEFVDHLHWIDEETMTDVLAVARSLPGVIAVNTSIIAGYKIRGIAGAIVSGLGCTIPSVLVLIVVTIFYERLRDSVYFSNMLRGIRGVVVAFILAAFWRLKETSIKDHYGTIIFAVVLIIAVFFRKINIAFLILGSIFAGLVIYYWKVFERIKK